MPKKGSRVTSKEAEEMYKLYQECGSMYQVAKTMRRDRGTVSRHIHAMEAKHSATKETIIVIPPIK